VKLKITTEVFNTPLGDRSIVITNLTEVEAKAIRDLARQMQLARLTTNEPEAEPSGYADKWPYGPDAPARASGMISLRIDPRNPPPGWTHYYNQASNQMHEYVAPDGSVWVLVDGIKGTIRKTNVNRNDRRGTVHIDGTLDPFCDAEVMAKKDALDKAQAEAVEMRRREEVRERAERKRLKEVDPAGRFSGLDI
jgi:hypothetical protein